MLRRWLSLGCVWVFFVALAPLSAAEGPLDVFTSDAAVIVRLKNVKGTTGKLAKLADAVVKGTGQQVQFGAGAIGTQINNPTLEGVDLAGDFYIAVYIAKEAAPAIAFGIPATDLEAMQEAVGDEVTFIPVGDKFAVYTADEELGEALKKQVDAEEGAITDAIDEKSAAAFNRGDLSVFVNVPSLLETFADEIALAQGGLEAIGQQEIPEGAIPGVDGAAALKLGQGILQGILQFVLDHEGITITLAINEKDVVIEEFFKVGDESETAKFLASNPGSDLKVLGQLPVGSLGYFGVHGNVNGFMDWALDAAKIAIKDENALNALEGMQKDMAGLKFGSMAGTFNLGAAETGMFHMSTVMELSDPKKMQAIQKKYGAAMANVEQNGLKPHIETKTGAEKIGTTAVDLTTVTYEVEEGNAQGEQALAMIKMMYGSETITTRQAYLKDKVVQTVGGGKASMETLLKSLESKTRATGSVESVRAKLGTKSNFVGLIDLANAIVQGMDAASNVAPIPLPLDSDQLKGLKSAPSYIGASVALEEGAISVKTVIPLEQIQSLAKVGMALGQAAQGGE